MLNNNWLALLITFSLALIWLRVNDFAAHRGWISSRFSRKIIHIGTGPLYVLCWPLFTNTPFAPFLASLVPLAFTVQFALIGFGIIKDEASVTAMSRTGDRREILRGPLYYGIIFVILTIVFWTRTPIGIVALMLMCGGDGLADILGRRFGRRPLPWSPQKTWMGSFGMLTGGWILSMGILTAYVFAGIFPGPLQNYLSAVTILALVGAVVESLPLHDIDNLTVTGSAVALGLLLW
jgi:phytol kinase